jgi:hypothetical protein
MFFEQAIAAKKNINRSLQKQAFIMMPGKIQIKKDSSLTIFVVLSCWPGSVLGERIAPKGSGAFI